MGEVVHRIQHELIGLVVVAQLRRTHILADEEVVQVPGKVIDEVEAKQVAGVAADFFQAGPRGPAGHGRPRGEIVPAEDEHGIQDGLHHQGVIFKARQRQPDPHNARGKAGAQDAERYLLELLLLEQQRIGNHIERIEKQLYRQQHAHRNQCPVSVKMGHGEGKKRKGAHQDESQPQREGENAPDILPAQFFVLDDACTQPHVREQAEKSGKHHGNGHYAKVFRHQDTGQRRVEQQAQHQCGVAGGGIQVNRLFDGRSGHGSAAHQVKQDLHGTDALLQFHFFFSGVGPIRLVGGNIFQMQHLDLGAVQQVKTLLQAFVVQDVLLKIEEGAGVKGIFPHPDEIRRENKARPVQHYIPGRFLPRRLCRRRRPAERLFDAPFQAPPGKVGEVFPVALQPRLYLLPGKAPQVRRVLVKPASGIEDVRPQHGKRRFPVKGGHLADKGRVRNEDVVVQDHHKLAGEMLP